MDDDDELVNAPDERGVLDLTNRAWVNLDSRSWAFPFQLFILDISYNHIEELPPQIGDLVMLRELRAAFNRLSYLPKEIGKLKRLRKLSLNGNKIRQLPDEIGRLDMLDELMISENLLETLPSTVGAMSTLRVLKLQNNRLLTLPHQLAAVVSLEDIDCTNNPKLDMVPENWRGHTPSLLFILKVHREYHVKMDEIIRTNEDLSKHCLLLEQEELTLRERLLMLSQQNKDLSLQRASTTLSALASRAATTTGAAKIGTTEDDRTEGGSSGANTGDDGNKKNKSRCTVM